MIEKWSENVLVARRVQIDQRDGVPELIVAHHTGDAVDIVTRHRAGNVLDWQAPLAKDVVRHGETPNAAERPLGIDRELTRGGSDGANPLKVGWHRALVPAERNASAPATEMLAQDLSQLRLVNVGDFTPEPRCHGDERRVSSAFTHGAEDAYRSEPRRTERHSERVADARDTPFLDQTVGVQPRS